MDTLRKERDALQARVTALEGALRESRKYIVYNGVDQFGVELLAEIDAALAAGRAGEPTA